MRRSRLRRQEEARERQQAHDKLTPAQKIAKLDKKLGVEQGAAKERRRLARMKENES